MSVYVLLAFDDDEDAKKLVETAVTLKGSTMGNPEVPVIPYTIRAVYKKPVKFCDCDRPPGWTRGKRFGWWVCSKCGKPGEAWAKGFVWYTALGTNLLPREICGEPPQPAGWDSPDAWTFLIKETPPVEETEPTAEISPDLKRDNEYRLSVGLNPL